jgi:hypothetical protein
VQEEPKVAQYAEHAAEATEAPSEPASDGAPDVVEEPRARGARRRADCVALDAPLDVPPDEDGRGARSRLAPVPGSNVKTRLTIAYGSYE